MTNLEQTLSFDTPSGIPDLSLTGSPEATLERAIVVYRGREERMLPGGLSRALGLGLVVAPPTAGSFEVLDLGSGRMQSAEAGAPFVILGWLFRAPFQQLRDRLLQSGSESLPPMAGRILSQLDLTEWTRPVFLRAGFRDVAWDLDPHDGTAVRMALGSEGVIRIHLDYATATLGIRGSGPLESERMVAVLRHAFPGREIRLDLSTKAAGGQGYSVRLLPGSTLRELHLELQRVRSGILRLLARWDPARLEALEQTLQGFGQRDLLGTLLPTTAERVH
jgi:hypothetical protein